MKVPSAASRFQTIVKLPGKAQFVIVGNVNLIGHGQTIIDHVQQVINGWSNFSAHVMHCGRVEPDHLRYTMIFDTDSKATCKFALATGTEDP